MAQGEQEQLLRALAAGDAHAYAALYDQLSAPLWRVARAMLRNAAEADDCLQDVFVELVRGRRRLGRVADLNAYVFSMLRHAVYKRAQRNKRQKSLLGSWPAREPSDKPISPTHDLDGALAKLPLDQREVIAMKIEGAMTFTQIGQVLGISPNTAASRYRYALEKLRAALE